MASVKSPPLSAGVPFCLALRTATTEDQSNGVDVRPAAAEFWWSPEASARDKAAISSISSLTLRVTIRGSAAKSTPFEDQPLGTRLNRGRRLRRLRLRPIRPARGRRETRGNPTRNRTPRRRDGNYLRWLLPSEDRFPRDPITRRPRGEVLRVESLFFSWYTEMSPRCRGCHTLTLPRFQE